MAACTGRHGQRKRHPPLGQAHIGPEVEIRPQKRHRQEQAMTKADIDATMPDTSPDAIKAAISRLKKGITVDALIASGEKSRVVAADAAGFGTLLEAVAAERDALIAEKAIARPNPMPSIFQAQVRSWIMACFGKTIADNVEERNHRFLEESLELVQALGCTEDDAHALVDYVYNRTVGDANQEVGGVMVTLAALCDANGFDMMMAGETELKRIWTKIDTIKAKQAAKPAMSPLPEAVKKKREPKCVNAHDRCYGGAGGPCPYCE
jgi:hypothetical protein